MNWIKIIQWLQGKYQWILALVLGIIITLIVRAYYKSVYKSDYLAQKLKDVEKVLKEQKRIFNLARKAENELPKDEPTQFTETTVKPDKFTICLALIFLLSACATTPCELQTISLPTLKTYTANHLPITFEQHNGMYCTGVENYDKILYNETEYKRVIKNYTDEILIYLKFKQAYEQGLDDLPTTPTSK